MQLEQGKRANAADSASTGNGSGVADTAGRAVIVHPYAKTRHTAGSTASRSPQSRLEEASRLARTIDLQILSATAVPLARPRPATLFGAGKVEELGAYIAGMEPDIVVIDGVLTPGQQRNLERAWHTKVIDRTGLILEIFGARARTKEGRLQVELAHLSYQRTRLVRSWTHLERQRGGFGFIGGPGETQIEVDRRLISERITKLTRELETVRRTRETHREGRRKTPYPIVAFVGYTNAGKSTLFNRLTDASVYADDLLFATLDPTMRGIDLPDGRRAILSDTVGFISDLPTLLVAAFRATLEEVLEADIIVHVRDISHPETAAQKADVLSVLEELGVSEQRRDDMVEVLNKTDLLDPEGRKEIENIAERARNTVPLCAQNGDGCPALLDTIAQLLSREREIIELDLAPEDGAGLSWLYRHAEVRNLEHADDGTAHVTVAIDPQDLGRFEKRER